MNHTFEIKGVNLNVTADFPAIHAQLNKLPDTWEEGCFTEAFSVDEGKVTRDEFMDDIEAMREQIRRLEQNPSLLEDHAVKIRKKKNGKFWSNSGTTISQMDYVCRYFTDFTNAWSVYQLRLESYTEETCILVLRQRTETF